MYNQCELYFSRTLEKVSIFVLTTIKDTWRDDWSRAIPVVFNCSRQHLGVMYDAFEVGLK